MFVANKGAVHITDLLFEVNLVPSEVLCPLWMEKFVQIGSIGSLWPVTPLHTKRNEVLASFFKIRSFWLMIMKAFELITAAHILQELIIRSEHNTFGAAVENLHIA